MNISDFDFFLVRGVMLGFTQKQLAYALNMEIERVHWRLLLLRKRYNVRKSREIGLKILEQGRLK